MLSNVVVLTALAQRLPIAATPNVLKREDPTIVPIPTSDSVMKVPMMLTKSSGVEVATDMKVAAATSCNDEVNNKKSVLHKIV